MSMSKYWSLAFASGAYEFFSPANYNDALLEAVREANLGVNDLVLDAGSGMGSLIPLCLEWLRSGGRLVCMDIDPKGLSATRRRAELLNFGDFVEIRQGDFTVESQFVPETFDVILSLFSLYAVADAGKRQRTLNNFYSALKQGGRFVLEVPSRDYSANSILKHAREKFETTTIQKVKANIRNILLKKWLSRLQSNLDSGAFHKFSEDELKLALSSAGFKKITIRKTYGGNAYLASAVK